MINLSYIEEIKKLGFTEYEAKCYLALFEKDSLTVPELARIAGVPKPNAYQTMESLLIKGFCLVIPGQIKRYSALDPQFAREKLFESLTNSMKAIDGMINNLNSLYKKTRGDNSPLDYIEVLKESPQCDKMYGQFIAESRKEVLILSKQKNRLYNESFNGKEDILDLQIKSGIDAIRRGVTAKCIYEISENEQTNRAMFKKVIDPFSKAGEQSRVKEDLPMRIAVFDEEIAMFSLVDPHETIPTETTQIVRHPVMARSFKIFFEAIWDKSEDCQEYKKRMGWI